MGALIDLNGLGHYKSKENAMVASVYSATKTYAVGDYAYYNGTLYRCTTAITTAEAWTSGHWTAAKIGDDVTELKSAFKDNQIKRVLDIGWVQGSITTNGGSGSSSNTNYNKRIRTDDKPLRIPVGYKLEVNVPEGKRLTVYYFSENTTTETSFGNSGWVTGTFVLYGTEQIKYVRLMLGKADNSNLTPSDAVGTVVTVYFKPEQFAAKPMSYMDVTTASVRGITIKKISDYQFSLSGSPSSTSYYKLFNVLLGADETSDTSIAEPERNITEQGTYVLFFETSRDGMSFRITYDATNVGTILKSGDTFEVKDKPATLFVYVDTSANFSTALFATWSLYKVDEFIENVPIYGMTEIDGVARALAKDAISKINVLTVPKSWGIANTLENAKQVIDIEWTPVANMPKRYDPSSGETIAVYNANEKNKGLPYSSVRDQDKAIGMDVSIHTFMTALKDPNSVIYKRVSTVSNSGCYYGTVCSGLINYCMGIRLNLTNYYLGNSDMFETVPMQDLNVGDMIWVSGHCAFISNIEKDEFGRITWVTVEEEWYPAPRTRRYGWNTFTEERDGYIARRFKKINGVSYESIPYIQCFDEELTSIVYPDVQTEFGDKAVFMEGEDVVVNVIDSTGYTNITVTRGTTQIHTTSTIATFTLSNVQAGLHTITATGNGKTSTSTFFVVDATASFNDSTGEVTFSSTNATPVMVGVYDLPSDREILVNDIILTDADRTAGQINVLSYMTSTRKYAKVWFKCDYGTAVWYSETHDKWIPYSE